MVTVAYDTRSRLRGVNVLLINNDLKILDLIENILQRLGFGNVFVAKDGFEAIQNLKNNKVDFVTTDWDLRPCSESAEEIPDNAFIVSPWGKFPPVSGVNFVRCLRHSPKSPNPFVPVIMMTGPTKKNNIMFARDSGVNEVLLKPIEAHDLCDRIISIIDEPRPFVTCEDFKGPCRRRTALPLLEGVADRRKLEIKLVEYNPIKHNVYW